MCCLSMGGVFFGFSFATFVSFDCLILYWLLIITYLSWFLALSIFNFLDISNFLHWVSFGFCSLYFYFGLGFFFYYFWYSSLLFKPWCVSHLVDSSVNDWLLCEWLFLFRCFRLFDVAKGGENHLRYRVFFFFLQTFLKIFSAKQWLQN